MTEKKQADAPSIEREVQDAFPGGEVERVEVLRYGDDPEVGPGESGVRVFLNLPDAGPGRPARERLPAFRDSHRDALRKLHDELRSQVWWIEYRSADQPGRGGGKFRSNFRDEPDASADLTPVMTRLGAADLATVDTLIAAGIGTSRAEVLRWAVGRIRENPAYDQLHERIQQIEDLKAKF